ncbi:MAG: YceI family protein [Solirubrobacteraceae bacterium]
MSTTTPQTTDKAAPEKTRWRIDPARSQVEFRTPTFWGLMTVRGHFERYDGTLDLRREPAIELTIEAGSLNTKNKMRDKHLRSGDFFDVANEPEVRFVSDRARLDGEKLTVSGKLYAAGKSIPLDVDATLRPVGGELEVDGTASADQFGLAMSHGMLGMIRPASELIVRGRLVRDGE